MIRAELSAMPGATEAGTPGSGAVDGSDASGAGSGVIAGFVHGATAPDSAWVLVVAARLLENPTAWQIATVQADGAYRATNLEEGTYYVMAGSAGHQPQFYREAYDLASAAPLFISPDLVMEGIDFFLQPLEIGSGVLSGVVFAGDGAARLAQAQVVAYPIDQPYRQEMTATDADGNYRFEQLFAGRYVVEAWADGYFRQYYDGVESFEQATPVVVADGAAATSIDFTLQRSGSISGRVVTPAGEPIAGASIFVQRAFTPNPDSAYVDPIVSAETNESGEYTVSSLSPGSYYVLAQAYGQWFAVFAWYDGATRFEDATPVAVDYGADTPGIDFVLDPVGQTGRIAGRVTTADGEPATQAYLRLEPYDDIPIYLSAYARVDTDGSYVFENVPVGRYRVALDFWNDVFYTSIWYDGVYLREEATPVEVIEDETTAGIDFTLPRADGVISGRILDTDGNPIAGASVFASPGSYIYPMDIGFGVGYGMTDADGAYTITGLIDGEYFVWTSTCFFWQCVERWWPDAASPAEADPVVLQDGVSNPLAVDLTLPLTQGTASLGGTVQDSNGQPLAGAMVTIAWNSAWTDPAEPGGSNPGPDGTTRPGDPGIPDSTIWYAEHVAYTDSLGAYLFPHLPTGTFTLSASYWEDGGYGIQWYDGVDTPQEATPIELNDGDALTGIDFTLEILPTSGTLAGTVVFNDGTAAGGAYIEASPYYWDYAAWAINPVSYYTLASDNGAFELTGLPNGTYFINVFAQGGRLLESVIPGELSRLVVEIKGGATAVIEVELLRVDEGDGRITGRVASEDSVGLSFAIVQAMVDDDPKRVYTALAGADGRYELTGLPDGDFIVWSFAPYHALEYYDDTYEPSDATRLDIRNGAAISGIDFDLSPIYYRGVQEDGAPVAGTASYLFGRVSDMDGGAISGATVYAMNEAGEVLSSVRTHPDGMYEIAGIAPGVGVRLMATYPGYVSRFHDGATSLDAAADLSLAAGRYEINFALIAGTSVGTEPDPELPSGVALRGNYPNPFNPETQIAFTLAEPMAVSVTIFDALGRRVTELYSGALPAGEQQLRWDATGAAGESMPSGLYFYRVSAEGVSKTGKMTLLR